MTECNSNHWLSQGAGFGHLSSKPWTHNASTIICVKIKPFFMAWPDIYWKLSVYSEFQDNVHCVHNIGPQSCVPRTWCTLYSVTNTGQFWCELTSCCTIRLISAPNGVSFWWLAWDLDIGQEFCKSGHFLVCKAEKKFLYGCMYGYGAHP